MASSNLQKISGFASVERCPLPVVAAACDSERCPPECLYCVDSAGFPHGNVKSDFVNFLGARCSSCVRIASPLHVSSSAEGVSGLWCTDCLPGVATPSGKAALPKVFIPTLESKSADCMEIRENGPSTAALYRAVVRASVKKSLLDFSKRDRFTLVFAPSSFTRLADEEECPVHSCDTIGDDFALRESCWACCRRVCCCVCGPSSHPFAMARHEALQDEYTKLHIPMFSGEFASKSCRACAYGDIGNECIVCESIVVDRSHATLHHPDLVCVRCMLAVSDTHLLLPGASESEDKLTIQDELKDWLGHCRRCSKPANKRCKSCKCVSYCSKECQKLHWQSHKKGCRRYTHGEIVTLLRYNVVDLRRLAIDFGCVDPVLYRRMLWFVENEVFDVVQLCEFDHSMFRAIDILAGSETGREAIVEARETMKKVKSVAEKLDEVLTEVQGRETVRMLAGTMAKARTTMDESAEFMRTASNQGNQIQRAVVAGSGPLVMLNQFIHSLSDFINVEFAGRSFTSQIAIVVGGIAISGVAIRMIKQVGYDIFTDMLSVVSSTVSLPQTIIDGIKNFVHALQLVRGTGLGRTEFSKFFVYQGHSGQLDGVTPVILAALGGLCMFVSEPTREFVLAGARSISPMVPILSAANFCLRSFIELLPVWFQRTLIQGGFYRPVGDISATFNLLIEALSGCLAELAKGKVFKVNEKRQFCRLYKDVFADRFLECAGKSSATNHYVSKILDDAKPHFENFTREVNAKSRVAPVGLWLYGAPGVGKSTILHLLSAILFTNLNSRTSTWHRNACDHFWSGWFAGDTGRGPPMVVFDDPFQCKPEEKAKIVDELLRLISTTDFYPVLAGLNEKGQIASPKLVVVSTNDEPTIDIPFVNEHAKDRRFLHIEMKISDRVSTNGKYDKVKMAAVDALEPGYRDSMVWATFSRVQIRREVGRVDLVPDGDLSFRQLLMELTRLMDAEEESADQRGKTVALVQDYLAGMTDDIPQHLRESYNLDFFHNRVLEAAEEEKVDHAAKRKPMGWQGQGLAMLKGVLICSATIASINILVPMITSFIDRRLFELRGGVEALYFHDYRSHFPCRTCFRPGVCLCKQFFGKSKLNCFELLEKYTMGICPEAVAIGVARHVAKVKVAVGLAPDDARPIGPVPDVRAVLDEMEEKGDRVLEPLRPMAVLSPGAFHDHVDHMEPYCERLCYLLYCCFTPNNSVGTMSMSIAAGKVPKDWLNGLYTDADVELVEDLCEQQPAECGCYSPVMESCVVCGRVFSRSNIPTLMSCARWVAATLPIYFHTERTGWGRRRWIFCDGASMALRRWCMRHMPGNHPLCGADNPLPILKANFDKFSLEISRMVGETKFYNPAQTELNNYKVFPLGEYFSFITRFRMGVSEQIADFRAKIPVVPLRQIICAVGVVTAVIGAGYALSTLFSYKHSSNEEDDVLVSGQASQKKDQMDAVTRALHAQVSHSAGPPLTDEDIASAANSVQVITKNLCAITRLTGKSSVFRMFAYLLDETTVVFPYHFLVDGGKMISAGHQLTLHVGHTTHKFEFHVAALTIFKREHMVVDMVLLDLKMTNVRLVDVPSTVRYLPEEDLKAEDLSQVSRHYFYQFDPNTGYNVRSVPTVAFQGEKTVIRDSIAFLPTAYKYDIGTTYGDCGGILVGISRGGCVRIEGMHASDQFFGTHSLAGFSVPMSRTTFAIVAHSGKLCERFVPIDEHVFPRMGPLPCKGDFAPSPIHNASFLSHIKRQPALLGDPLDGRSAKSALELQIDELNRWAMIEPGRFTEEEICDVSEGIVYHLKRVPWEFRAVLSDDEMLNGVAAIGSRLLKVKPMNVKTSSGWPLCTNPRIHGKRPVIMGEKGGYSCSPELYESYKSLWDEIVLTGTTKRFLPIVRYGKCELVSEKKILEERTRQITCFPLVVQMLGRKVFGAFIDFVQASYLKIASGVGMNPHSPDWDEMITKLLKKGQYGWDGDYTRFEQNLGPEEVRVVREVTDWFYGDGDHEARRVRHWILEHMLRTPCVVGNKAFYEIFGLKSGGVGTTSMFGFIMNMFYYRVSWSRIMKERRPDISSQDCFEDFVELFTFGDDNIASVDESLLDVFNCCTLQSTMASFGVLYTPADKEGEIVPFKPIIDLSFLKMKSRQIWFDSFVSGRQVRFIGVPSRDDVLPSLKWVRTSLPLEVGLLVNANDILARCVGWSFREFGALRYEIRESLDSVGIRGNLLTRDICRERWAEDRTIVNSCRLSLLPMDFPQPYVYRKSEAVVRHSSQIHAAEEVVDPETNYSVQKLGPRAAKPTLNPRGFCIRESQQLCELARKFCPWRFNSHQISFEAQNSSWMYDLSSPDGPVSVKPGFGYWFSRLYQFYHDGGIRFAVQSNGDCYMTSENWTLDERAVFGPAYKDWGNGVTPRGVPHNAYGMRDKNGIYEVPFVTNYNMLRVPRGAATADGGQEQYFSSWITMQVANTHPYEPTAVTNIQMSCTEDCVFSWPREIPNIRLVLPDDVVLPVRRRQKSTLAHSAETIVADEIEQKTSDGGVGVVHQTPDTIGDRQLTFVDFARRKQFITSIIWGIGDVVGTSLWSGNNPYDLLGNVNRIPFDQFVYYRGDARIHFELDSQPFMCGKLKFIYCPCITLNDLSIGTTSRVSQTFGYNADLYAGGPRSLVVDLPYVHPRSFLRIETDNIGRIFPSGIGKFRLVVFNKLNVGLDVAQTKCNIAVFVSFPNPKFDVMRRRTGAFGHSGGKFSKSKIGEDENYPTVARNAVPVVDYANFDVSNITDFAPTRVLGFTNSDQNDFVPGVGGTRGSESTIGFLMGRKCWAATVLYTDSPPGLILGSFPMTIAPVMYDADVGVSNSVTSMEYAALPFTYWQADLVYTFEVVGTKFHAGRLGFATVYGRFANSGSDLRDLMSQNSVFFDVGGEQNVWEFVVPFKAQQDMLRVPYYPPADLALDQFSMGTAVLFVVTPLQSTSQIPAQIDINISLSARNVKMTMPRPMTAFRVVDFYWPAEREKAVKEEQERELKEYLLEHPRDPRAEYPCSEEEEKF